MLIMRNNLNSILRTASTSHELSEHRAAIRPKFPTSGFRNSSRIAASALRRPHPALRLVRTLHELEPLQRMRKGESLPASATVDVNVHADTGIVDSVPAASGQLKALPGDEE